MTEYFLCPFDFLQFGPLLAVHNSILLMNAYWSGADLRPGTAHGMHRGPEGGGAPSDKAK